MKKFITIAAFGLLVSGMSCLAADTYKFIKDIPIPGRAQWDYLRVDADAHRLYVSHGTKVEVIDLDKGTIIGAIEGTPGVHGMAIVPKLGKVFTSNGQEAKASVVDIKTLQTLSKVSTGANPDSILYEETQNEVYTFNGRGKSVTAFKADTGEVVATIDVGGKPESAAADGKAGQIYVNIEDKNEVVVIDIKAHKVVNRWPIAPGAAATGMAFDAEHHRLFLGCDNKKMVMMDSTNGKVVTTIPVGAGVDACSFDPATQLVFASAGEDGTTTIAKVNGDQLTVVQTLKTAGGARTMTLNPVTHEIYLPAPTPSFRVMVYGLEK
jgi:DNA-binding beta-propeller fold protein YncE